MGRGITAIVGATALVGAELEPVPQSAIVIDGERIREVGPRDRVGVPPHAVTVDAAGLTIAPGFVDAHVHIGFYDPVDVLARGVTTVRDLGWPATDIFSLARASARPDFLGPTILAAGQILTAPGGYPTRAAWAPPGTGLEVPRPVDAPHAVRLMADAGACVIKVALNPPAGPSLDAATLTAIVEAAHARPLRVTGHVFGLEELHKALDAGLDELAHVLMSPEPIPQDTLERMVAQGMVMVPTMAIFNGRARDIALANLRDFLESGGTVVYGTDLGNEGPRPGIDAREVAAMAEAGMSGRDIIAAATSAAASLLGLDSIGSVTAGMAADLVAFHGDPLREPAALTRVARVWRRGTPIE